MTTDASQQLVDHFFRREYGNMVATLCRLVGFAKIDLVEDMVQSALVEALQAWRQKGIPDDPARWVHRVARNKLIDSFRRQETERRHAPSVAARQADVDQVDAGAEYLFDSREMADSQLRLMFTCCHPALPAESSIPLTLRSLCGFSDAEIARGMLHSEPTIRKRIYRAKQLLIERQVELELPSVSELRKRLDTVHQVLYLIFNEGYHSVHHGRAIREELCEEAARLCHLLCEHAQLDHPESNALLALMLFHAARLKARQSDDGGTLLLEDQDRSLWDRSLIRMAEQFLMKSAEGEGVSQYHLEAAIAMYHCRAANLAATDWPSILKLYDVLIGRSSSPLYLLNRAIVISQIDGPDAGIEEVEKIAHEPLLRNYHLLHATLGELHLRAGHHAQARRSLELALHQARSPHDRVLIEDKLRRCDHE